MLKALFISMILLVSPASASFVTIKSSWSALYADCKIPQFILPETPKIRQAKCSDPVKIPQQWQRIDGPTLTTSCAELSIPDALNPDERDSWMAYKKYCKYILPDLTGQYEVVDEVGEGGCGKVWKARDMLAINASEEFVAIKCSFDIRKAIVEAGHLRGASESGHRNIVRWKGTFGYLQPAASDGSQPARPVACIVQELVSGDNLLDVVADKIRKNTPVPVDFVQDMFRQALQAIAHVHELGMVHRDIKLDNFILDSATNELKFADFGYATYDRDYFKGMTPPDITFVYPARWSTMSCAMNGYDPALTSYHVAWLSASTLPKLNFFATDMYAAGTMFRGLFTGEASIVVGFRDSLLDEKIRAKVHAWVTPLLGGEDSPAWRLYMMTRAPIAKRITIRQMLDDPFLRQAAQTGGNAAAVSRRASPGRVSTSDPPTWNLPKPSVLVPAPSLSTTQPSVVTRSWVF